MPFRAYGRGVSMSSACSRQSPPRQTTPQLPPKKSRRPVRRPQKPGRRLQPAFLRAFDALRAEARYCAPRSYIFWTTTFSAELCTAPIFTCAGFMPTVSCHRVCPAVSVRLRLTVNCALIPMGLGFAKITHCAWPLLRGSLLWNHSREELTAYARVPAIGVPSGYL